MTYNTLREPISQRRSFWVEACMSFSAFVRMQQHSTSRAVSGRYVRGLLAENKVFGTI